MTSSGLSTPSRQVVEHEGGLAGPATWRPPCTRRAPSTAKFIISGARLGNEPSLYIVMCASSGQGSDIAPWLWHFDVVALRCSLWLCPGAVRGILRIATLSGTSAQSVVAPAHVAPTSADADVVGVASADVALMAGDAMRASRARASKLAFLGRVLSCVGVYATLLYHIELARRPPVVATCILKACARRNNLAEEVWMSLIRPLKARSCPSAAVPPPPLGAAHPGVEATSRPGRAQSGLGTSKFGSGAGFRPNSSSARTIPVKLLANPPSDLRPVFPRPPPLRVPDRARPPNRITQVETTLFDNRRRTVWFVLPLGEARDVSFERWTTWRASFRGPLDLG